MTTFEIIHCATEQDMGNATKIALDTDLNWIEIYETADTHTYGLLSIDIDGEPHEVAACVGIRESDRETAKQVVCVDGYIDAWYVDSSDYDGIPQAMVDQVLEVIYSHRVALYREDV